MVEAEGFEPSCQAANTQASTSIAGCLNFARRPPVGRLPVALAVLWFPCVPDGGSPTVARMVYIQLPPAGGAEGDGTPEGAAFTV